MSDGISSFETYVQRRLRVGGRAMLDEQNPYFLPIDQAREEAARRGIEFLSFAHYDYLDLAGNAEVRGAMVEALDRIGPGVGASRLVGGERSGHRAFERDLAEFLHMPASITLVSGYLTNLSLIPHVAGGRDLVILDELVHNSIVTATQGRSSTNTATFRHNDLDHLESILAKRRGEFRNVLIAVESLYSMDGDVVDLPRLLALKERFDAWLLVDEAHSIGVLGETGRGIAEHFGVDPKRIDLITGTLSKTFVTAGGFVAASEAAVEFMRYSLPGFVFSVGLPPMVTEGAHTALNILRREPQRVARLRHNAEHFCAEAIRRGLDIGVAIGRGVVPILFQSTEETMAVATALFAQGIYAPPIVHIGVPREAPRIRFFISAGHDEAKIARVLDAIAAAVAEHRAGRRAAAVTAPNAREHAATEVVAG